jgi:hypothetical protein
VTAPYVGIIGGDVSVPVTASSERGVVLVQAFLDDLIVAEDDRAPFILDWSTLGFDERVYAFRVVATDIDGARGEHQQYVEIDNTPPRVTISGLDDDEFPVEIRINIEENTKLAGVDILQDYDGSFGFKDHIEIRGAQPFVYVWDYPFCWQADVRVVAWDVAGWTSVAEDPSANGRLEAIGLCDMDCDGYGLPTADCGSGSDCNDADAAIHPGAFDEPGDGVDQDCDGNP